MNLWLYYIVLMVGGGLLGLMIGDNIALLLIACLGWAWAANTIFKPKR